MTSPHLLWHKDTESETELMKALSLGSFALGVFSVSFYIFIFSPSSQLIKKKKKKKKYREGLWVMCRLEAIKA